MIKTILVGLVGAIALSLPAQAQSYEPFPDNTTGCRVIINYICHSELDDGSPSLAAIPSVYSGRYVLLVQGADYLRTLVAMYDLESSQIASYIILDSNSRLVNTHNGRPGYGGNVRLFEEITDEVVDLVVQFRLY